MLRHLAFCLAAFALAARPADASFISTSPDPLLGGSLISTGPPIDTQFGYATFTIANIEQTSNVVAGGVNTISYTASPILSFYSDPGLTNLLATATLTGQFVIEILNRSSPFQTGTFDFTFASSTATGIVGGAPVTVQLDPSQTSFGTTTITAGPGIGEFTIDTTATQFSQFSFDGVRFEDVPPIDLVGVPAVPEPASLSMLALALVGLGFARRRLA